MSRLLLDRLRRTYGASIAVDRADLQAAEGELVALLGPFGCGKTTTLRMVAGLVAPSKGHILIGRRDVTRTPPHPRDAGMVFQDYALFPHMTVAQNVGFGLEMRRIARAERDRRVADALRLVRLDGLADRRPAQLSGGQQQRVALARAMVDQRVLAGRAAVQPRRPPARQGPRRDARHAAPPRPHHLVRHP